MPICALSKFCRGAFITIVLAALPMLFAVATNANPLAVDPHVFSGQLENGMRYAVMPNDGPANTASVRLYLGVGSLHETDHERGFAHFVEHMAFNGSDAFPEGELVKALQNAGLAFGAHANASTDFEKTLYKLELPNVDDTTIDLAFTALRETAGNLSFTEEAINNERGVLVSELEARNGKGLRVFRERLKFWDATSRANERFAAGTKDVISGASRDELIGFYRAFYRPENAFLVFVGDVEVDAIEEKIKTVFSDWQNDTPARNLDYMKERLQPDEPSSDHVIFSLDGINTTLSMTVVKPYRQTPDSAEKRALLIKRSMANVILAQRLDKLARQADAPLQSARVSHSRLFQDVMLANFHVNTSDDRLLEAAALMEQEMRRLLTHGFTEDEVTEQKANFRLSFQYQVDSADKRPNAQLADAIVSAFHEGTTVVHPEDQLEIYTDLENSLTVVDLNAVFAGMWAGKPRFFATTSAAVENGPAKLAVALEASTQVAVAPPEINLVTEFGYSDFGTPGDVVWREESEELEFTKVRFANNLMVNLKPTQWEDNTVRMLLRLGGGVAELPVEYAGLQNLMNVGFVNGGIGKHEVTDIPRLMAGRSASIRLQTSNSAFVMPAGVVPQDILLQFQLWAAYLNDPGFRESAHGQYVRTIESYFQTYKSSPSGVASARIADYLYDDPRLHLQSLETLKAFTMDDLKAAMTDTVRHGALELTIVGDFDINETLDALSQTLGALPERNQQSKIDPVIRQVKFPAKVQDVKLLHEGGKDQARLYLYWPTVGRGDHQLEAELLLKDLLQVMVIEALREDASLAYTPSVSKFASHIFDNFGFLSITTDIGPAEIEQAKTIFLKTVGRVVQGEIDQALLERARRPLLERLRNERKNNGRLLSNLQLAQSYPDYVTYYAGLPKTVEMIKLADLIAVAKTYLASPPRMTVQVTHVDTPTVEQ